MSGHEMLRDATPAMRHEPQLRSEADVRHIALNASRLLPKEANAVDEG